MKSTGAAHGDNNGATKRTGPDSRNDNRPTARGRYEPPTRFDLAGCIPNLHMCDPRVDILIRELTQGDVSEDSRMSAWPTLCSLLLSSEFHGFGIVSNAYLDFLQAEATAKNLPFQRTLVLCMGEQANPLCPLYDNFPYFLRTLHVDKIVVRAPVGHTAPEVVSHCLAALLSTKPVTELVIQTTLTSPELVVNAFASSPLERLEISRCDGDYNPDMQPKENKATRLW